MGGQRLKQNRGHTWIKGLWMEAKRDHDYFTAREEGQQFCKTKRLKQPIEHFPLFLH